MPTALPQTQPSRRRSAACLRLPDGRIPAGPGRHRPGRWDVLRRYSAAVPNRFYRRRWNETRGEDFDDWGRSLWYFEVGDDGWPVRQIEVYDAGHVLRYGPGHTVENRGNLQVPPGQLDAFEQECVLLAENVEQLSAATGYDADRILRYLTNVRHAVERAKAVHGGIIIW